MFFVFCSVTMPEDANPSPTKKAGGNKPGKIKATDSIVNIADKKKKKVKANKDQKYTGEGTEIESNHITAILESNNITETEYNEKAETFDFLELFQVPRYRQILGLDPFINLRMLEIICQVCFPLHLNLNLTGNLLAFKES